MNLTKLLGVDLDEEFSVEGYKERFKITDVTEGKQFIVMRAEDDGPWSYISFDTTYDIIHLAPDGILHLPELTSAKISQLKALLTLGYNYMVKGKDGLVYAHGKEPKKYSYGWESYQDYCFACVPNSLEIYNLVSFSDETAYDIRKNLGGRYES